MALSSERHDSAVNPDRGIYVEMESVMEVRYASDDPDYRRPSEDFKDFQERVREIPEDYCHKDRTTTEQAFFFCLVCNCDLKSLKPLRDHVMGSKHIRKACDHKRAIMGLPNEPQNAPKVKKIKKDKPRVDIGQTLQERLSECGEPPIGLEYVTEYVNPRNPKDHRMYTCSLDGCKSAWGTSDDIYNHVIKPKHHKNFFKKLNPEDSRVAGLSGAAILTKAAEYEQEQIGDGDRDYSVILRKENYDEYMELRNRPDDWSEKKASLGLVGRACNSNMEPLGRKRTAGPQLGDREREATSRRRSPSPMFDPVAWAGWQPVSRDRAVQDFATAARGGVADVRDLVEEFKGKKGDEEHEEIEHYSKVYRDLLEIMAGDLVGAEAAVVAGLQGELGEVREGLVQKLEGEDRAMKEVSRMMAELEEEIVRYNSERTTNKYKNVQERLGELTKRLASFKPAKQENVTVKQQHNERLGKLWKDFEARSDSLSQLLEQQMEPEGGAGSGRKLEVRKAAVEAYRLELVGLVAAVIEREYGHKFLKDEARMCGDFLVKDKYLNPEVNSFTKKGESWTKFKVTERTKDAVQTHLKSKMAAYKQGDVYKWMKK